MTVEKIDLDEARQKEILALEAKLGDPNHFDFLGVPTGASADDVRNAFREASRKFHPDRYFGKNLGSFRTRLDRIFKRLVEANQTLTDPQKRELYFDAHPFIRAASRASQIQARPAEPKTELEAARDAERRNRLARHPYLARATKVHESLMRAKEQMAKGEFSQAFSTLNAATQADPQNQEVKALLVEARKRAELSRSDTSFNHAMEALNRGDTTLAMQALKTAVTANPHNHKAAFKAANLFEKHGDPREASSFAQKAVEAEPNNVEYRVLLGRLLMESGMKALAKKHFEEAAKLDPENPEVKKYGKRLWPF